MNGAGSTITDIREAAVSAATSRSLKLRPTWGQRTYLEVVEDERLVLYGLEYLAGEEHTRAAVAEINRIFDHCDRQLQNLGRRLGWQLGARDTTAVVSVGPIVLDAAVASAGIGTVVFTDSNMLTFTGTQWEPLSLDAAELVLDMARAIRPEAAWRVEQRDRL